MAERPTDDPAPLERVDARRRAEAPTVPQPTDAQLILAELRAIREQLELLNRSVGLKAESPLLVEVVR